MNSSLPTAQLAIYALLTPLVVWLWWKHRWSGALGWGYLFAFTTLRVVGGAMSMGHHDDNSGAAIISSVGISPLLLTVDGILHEAKVYRNPTLNRCAEWSFIGLMHLLVATGVALVATGASALTGANPSPGGMSLLKTGMGLLTASWVILDIATIVAYLPSQHSRSVPSHHHGTVLLWSAMAGLILVGVRVLYSLVAETTQRPDLNPITGSLAVRVVLAFLPELLATGIFIIAGIMTRDARQGYKGA